VVFFSPALNDISTIAYAYRYVVNLER